LFDETNWVALLATTFETIGSQGVLEMISFINLNYGLLFILELQKFVIILTLEARAVICIRAKVP